MVINLSDKDLVVGRTLSDLKKYEDKATGYIGKVVVSGGEEPVLGKKILMDLSRSHVAIVCGKRGGGKCLHENTLITLENGCEIKIKDLQTTNQKIMALTSKYKILKKEKTKFYKRTVSELLLVKLRSGKEIKLTPEHPLLTLSGWKPIQKLNIGSRIATPRKINVFGKLNTNPNNIKILAYLLTEGHLRNNFILFTNSDKTIMAEFKKTIHNFDDNLEIKNHSKYTCRIVNTNIKRKIVINKRQKNKFTKGIVFDKKNKLRKYLENIGIYNKLAIKREIPQIIFKQNKKNLALFLNRLFSCDGSIYFEKPNRSIISYSTSSKKMILQVQSLLLRFGILSIIREKKTKVNKNYELKILSQHNYKFKTKISLFGKKKLKIKKIKPLKKTNPNVDTIPKEIWTLYKPKSWVDLGKLLNYKTPKSARSNINFSPSRKKLRKIAEFEKDNFLIDIANSDIYWDEIKEIKKIKGTFTVYDITVPKEHNFVANNIVVHNSYSMSVLIEEFGKQPFEVRERLSAIIIDTVGIFWTMKFKNEELSESLCGEWDIKPSGMEIRTLIPEGKADFYKEKNIPFDSKFSIKTSQMDFEDWLGVFRLDWKDPESALLSRTLETLKKKLGNLYDIEDIISVCLKDEETTKDIKNALINRMKVAKTWGLFSKSGTTMKEFAKPATITTIDVSTYKQSIGMESVQELIVGILGKRLYEERMLYRKEEEINLVEGKQKTSEMPVIWMMIDEAHMFMPQDRSSMALDVLLQWIRVGRQPGLSLLLATQRPNKLHSEAISQCDFFLSMRMTAQEDIQAVSTIRPSYLNVPMDKFYAQMPKSKGFAILVDDNSEKVMLIKIRPRETWDGGKTANVFLD